MKVRILTSAYADLAAGRDFYEKQGEALDAYSTPSPCLLASIER